MTYTGFESNGYDEDVTSSFQNFSYTSTTKITPIHSDDAYSIFNKALKNHNGKLVIGINHDEHTEIYKSRKNIYSITHPTEKFTDRSSYFCKNIIIILYLIRKKMTEYTGFESNGYDRDVSSDFESFEYSAPRNAHDAVF